MKIVGKQNFGKQGRIVVTNLYPLGKVPEKVILSIDLDLEMISIEPYNESNIKYGGPGTLIDSKNRLILPKWIIEELCSLSEQKELFLIIDNDNKRYLSPKTGNTL